jgi:hypothetical protein
MNAFEVKNPDLKLSPHTGMSKKHYIECAKYLLERAFTLILTGVTVLLNLKLLSGLLHWQGH